MLNGYDRLLLTQAIVPPTGYALDEALGTTYSLDLLALVAVSLAASGVDAEMLEKPEPGDALVLLEAVRRQYSPVHDLLPGRRNPCSSGVQGCVSVAGAECR